MTKATKYIRESAARVTQSGADVDWDNGYSTVTISAPNEDDIFMQGQEADNFISEAEKLCKKYRSLDMQTACAALAEPYTENIWG